MEMKQQMCKLAAMNRSFLLSLLSGLLCLSVNRAVAQSAAVVPERGPTTQAFVPAGYKVTHSVNADFNADGTIDAAVIALKEQSGLLIVVLKNKDDTYRRSEVLSTDMLAYASKLAMRGNNIQIDFDLPAYSAGHIITVYSRLKNDSWELTGYSETSYEDLESKSGNSATPNGEFKDVNLLTGDVQLYKITGKKKALSGKQKEKVVRYRLRELDQAPFMQW